jgi:hypothetical protein
MRYRLEDKDLDPARLLAAPRYDHTIADVVGADEGGAAAVLRDFIEGVPLGELSHLQSQAARGAGSGHEFASSMYDDDLDEGDEPFEGVLNVLSVRNGSGLTTGGYRIDYGTSYVQVVGFDERGPRAQALLTYGESSDPSSPHASDQLRLYSARQWPRLPFHPDEVARERVGPVLELRR